MNGQKTKTSVVCGSTASFEYRNISDSDAGLNQIFQKNQPSQSGKKIKNQPSQSGDQFLLSHKLGWIRLELAQENSLINTVDSRWPPQVALHFPEDQY